MRPLFRLLLSSGLLALCALLPQVAGAAEKPPAQLIEQLGAEEFKVREEAQKALLEWALKQPDRAIEQIYALYSNDKDPEISVRCRTILGELLTERFESEGHGFIGIQMMDVEAVTLKDQEKPVSGVRVTTLIAGMAGEKAGLKRDDIIFEIDGIRSMQDSPSMVLREHVQGLKPNTVVKLRILRGQEVMNLEMRIGRRPEAANDPAFGMWPRAQIDQAIQEERETYLRSWLAEREKSL